MKYRIIYVNQENNDEIISNDIVNITNSNCYNDIFNILVEKGCLSDFTDVDDMDIEENGNTLEVYFYVCFKKILVLKLVKENSKILIKNIVYAKTNDGWTASINGMVIANAKLKKDVVVIAKETVRNMNNKTTSKDSCKPSSNITATKNTENKQELFDRLYNECLNEVENAGIEIGNITSYKINNRLTSTWGRCSRKTTRYGDYYFSIEISGRLLDTSIYTEQAIKTTIIHELLHTVYLCFNHGEHWKSVANVMNCKYGYNIKRTTADSEKQINPNNEHNYKYNLFCSVCDKIIYGSNRATKYIKRYNVARCGYCKNEYLTLKTF